MTIPPNKLPCSNSTPEPDPEIKGPEVQKQPELFFDDLSEKYTPEVVSIDDNDSDQSYRKRYNLIDCRHKKQFLCALNKKIVGMYPLHRCAISQFPFRWIYYYRSNKSTGKDKTHLCALG